ncbi:MAG: HAD family phosphatase [Clostridiales bacterium]|jgi:HAD superfamily hydrolase (TIGR01509 family)|nr:HAD family phosphatase [Clostridiales bacterium]
MIKAAIFDLDGTLLDSLGVWERIDEDFLSRRGLSVTDEYTDAVSVLRFYDAAVFTKNYYNLSESAEAILAEWRKRAVSEYSRTVALLPGAALYLERLKAAGLRICAATTLDESLYAPALARNGITGFFESVRSTSEVSRGKEFPDIYLYAARKMGVAPKECAVFEDVPKAAASAKAAGTTVYGVTAACSARDAARLAEICDGIIGDFTSAPLPR